MGGGGSTEKTFVKAVNLIVILCIFDIQTIAFLDILA